MSSLKFQSLGDSLDVFCVVAASDMCEQIVDRLGNLNRFMDGVWLFRPDSNSASSCHLDVHGVRQLLTKIEELNAQDLGKPTKTPSPIASHPDSCVRNEQPESRLVRDLAEMTCKRISRQVRIALTKMTEYRLSGDDTPLRNAWEEICVQRQTEESFAWAAYEATITTLVQSYVGKLQRFELEAVFLQTDNAWDILDEEIEIKRPATDRIPVCEEDVIKYIVQDYVLKEAVNWSNSRIRDYIDRSYSD